MSPPGKQPNVVLVLADDLGYSDLGCYGSEIATPNLDALADGGVRMRHFTTTARCSPSRASLLTGLHPHQAGIGVLTDDDGPGGYPGNLNDRCVTIAEALGAAGYATYMSGKWHVSHEKDEPSAAWPTRRGFERFFGTLDGGGNYFAPAGLHRGEEDISHEARDDPHFYYTDAISDNAAAFIREHAAGQGERPFFCYVAYTAPHFPLHARDSDIAAYAGRYAEGWDVVRQRRFSRMRELGVVGEKTELSPRDPQVSAWEDAEDKDWEQRRMEVYAAMVEVMDRGIGRIVDELRDTGQLDNTAFVFLSDNGGSAEDLPASLGTDYANRGPKIIPAATTDGRAVRVGQDPRYPPGGEDTFMFAGRAWANVSNAPFRLHKRWIHEGGIASPFIVHWPDGLAERAGTVVDAPHYLPDIMPTLLEVADAAYPDTYSGREVLPLEGISMLGSWRGKPGYEQRCQFYEHIGNAAVRRGPWKLAREYPGDWELYDVDVDPTELHDLAGERPGLVRELAYEWAAWAARCGVVPRERILELARWGLTTES
ncbi:sulfatase-like hydrolase/transferase [Phytoactinopolyspora mesophila]|uniref:Sulfatase-like hydrolase/transferase n=1 Tax=Phytoactinopolyspora mesophila TaxID=2650750 RepID=A0A7K3M873_9ACTN|nr:sulfatase-like hydrolase/transferase [Phytoactinopolyspora mesophila]